MKIDRGQLKDRLQTLPTKPGVYLMKDEKGKVIYVGKAVNLRSRVRSYFHASAHHSAKVRRMVAKIADVDFIVTDSEVEALILECNLIKEHRPQYNIRLKDDKRYPYIKVAWQDDFPRVYATRRMEQDGARYFGPYASAGAVHQTLDLLRKIFPYLTCKRKITGQDERACLYYHLGRCLAPCIGAISQEGYRDMIEQICLFLEGRTGKVIADLEARMRAAAENLNFEHAAAFRDQIQAVERITESQKVVSLAGGDRDVIAWARDNGDACVQVFFVREGKLIGHDYFVLEGVEKDEDAGEILSSFVKQFYAKAASIPPEVLLPHGIEGAMLIRRWLEGRREAEVTLRTPQRSEERELVEMAAENAAETLASLRAQWLTEDRRRVEALA
ncbi:MAG: excinuclease ABC subunit UvrC, partial [Chloroflexota bacterium]|nr:excinuclease ABC subunit UvrC [Chloroflexota bacterium]